MTNLTRLRLILVDLSGLMKKRTHLKQNVLFFKVVTSCNKLFSNTSNLSVHEVTEVSPRAPELEV